MTIPVAKFTVPRPKNVSADSLIWAMTVTVVTLPLPGSCSCNWNGSKPSSTGLRRSRSAGPPPPKPWGGTVTAAGITASEGSFASACQTWASDAYPFAYIFIVTLLVSINRGSTPNTV